jgi:hypothetical protein
MLVKEQFVQCRPFVVTHLAITTLRRCVSAVRLSFNELLIKYSKPNIDFLWVV